MTEFERAVAAEVKRIRESLTPDYLGLNSFHFEIEAEGRVHEGEVKITFALYVNYGETIKGGSVEAVVMETLRRKGWADRNAPLELSHLPPEPDSSLAEAIDSMEEANDF